MSYVSPYLAFIFEDYKFDQTNGRADFTYSFDSEMFFTESVYFDSSEIDSTLNLRVLDNALRLAFYVAGTSYYKTFPTKNVIFKSATPNLTQANFLQKVYLDGLSQFIFENKLSLNQMANFSGLDIIGKAVGYKGGGVLALQSGGKDSLLLAELLKQKRISYHALYIASGNSHPEVLSDLGVKLRVVKRYIDHQALKDAAEHGGLNGHVPVTYIIQAYALIDAILHNENTILSSIGNEGEEPHEFINNLPINHQWSKTRQAEQLLVSYVSENVSPDIQIGSPLRKFSELQIAELFVKYCWRDYRNSFSSCNRANYKQGEDNSRLKWCGDCPKCANSYLLFAPFVKLGDLHDLFNGEDLLKKASLEKDFKGLLGIDGEMKPFECVGEVDELRLAYNMAVKLHGVAKFSLSYEVPESNFDYKKVFLIQQKLDDIL